MKRYYVVDKRVVKIYDTKKDAEAHVDKMNDFLECAGTVGRIYAVEEHDPDTEE